MRSAGTDARGRHRAEKRLPAQLCEIEPWAPTREVDAARLTGYAPDMQPADSRSALAPLLAHACVLALACGPKPRAAEPTRIAPLPPDAYAHYLRGRIAVYEGDYPTAVREFGAAAKAAPREAPIAVARIDALARAGHDERADQAAKDAQRRWPDHPEVWLASGQLYRRQGRDLRAREAYERALALDPDLEPAYLGLASTWVRLQQPARAEDTYRELLEHAPGSIAGNYRLAVRLAGRDAHRDAARHLRRVLDLEPDHLEARLALARSLQAMGNAREALATLRIAFDRSRGDVRVGEQLVIQLLEAGDRRAALGLLAQMDRDELPERTKIAIGYKYLQLGERDEAIARADAILAVYPVSADARLLKAEALTAARLPDADRDGSKPAASTRAHETANETARAIALLLEVAPEWPGYSACRAFAVELLARSGDRRRALEVVEQALVVFPRDAALLIAHARAYEHLGEIARAREVLASALAAQKRNPELLYALGALEDRQGRPERAVALMQRILSRDPDHAGALNFIGYSLADRGVELQRARRLLERALALAPGDGYVLDSYGWLLFRLGRHAEAAAALERAARLTPTQPEVMWHLAEVAAARNDHARALALLAQARALAVERRVRARIDARMQALRAGP